MEPAAEVVDASVCASRLALDSGSAARRLAVGSADASRDGASWTVEVVAEADGGEGGGEDEDRGDSKVAEVPPSDLGEPPINRRMPLRIAVPPSTRRREPLDGEPPPDPSGWTPP